jgi:hypothetical protein
MDYFMKEQIIKICKIIQRIDGMKTKYWIDISNSFHLTITKDISNNNILYLSSSTIEKQNHPTTPENKTLKQQILILHLE